MKFNVGKAIWKVFLGAVSTGVSIVLPNLLPQIVPEPIWKLSVGGLILEGIDWIIHKIGANK